MNKYFKNLLYFILIFTAVIGAWLLVHKKNKSQVAGVQTELQLPVAGIILPHHKLADELITKSFEKVSAQHYSYVVIFGPNHFVPEANSVVTARSTADFNFESEIMDKFLTAHPDVLVSDDITSSEHSIMLHLPFIKYYFPNARVIPLIISPYASKTEIFDIVGYLTSQLPEDTLYIASVDFAHNTMAETGLKNNEESIEAIRSLDTPKILKYTDDHMDSPLSISALIIAMQNLNKTKWETWYSSHSALLKDDPSVRGTSYVIGAFR